ncbi:MAG: diguanylate cyclase [Lachnospiraceae bacterium]|nr:diguanylate cyclase [Lachnospiraceae bacterium]
MRVGFASADGKYVNEHFGHSKYWEIVDIPDEDADTSTVSEGSADSVVMAGTRMVRSGCNCHDPKLFDDMLVTLADCDILVVARIGQEAAEYVISKGKRVFEATGEITAVAERLKESINASEAV